MVEKNTNQGRSKCDCSLQGAILLASLLTGTAAKAASPSEAPGLTNIQQVLDLGLDGARLNRSRVEIDGVVTFVLSSASWIYVQDKTAGGLVVATNTLTERFAGQKVRVRGIAGAGLFSPFIGWANVEVKGTNALPTPLRMPIKRYQERAAFGQWAEVECTVRDVFQEWSGLGVRAVQDGAPLDIQVSPVPGPILLDSWPDTQAKFRGVVWTLVDGLNKPIGFTLHVPGTNFIEVVSSPGPQLWNQPLATIASLRGKVRSDRRLKVRATFLYQIDQRTQAFRTETGGLFVQLLGPFMPMDGRKIINRPKPPDLAPGDVVEVLGAATNSTWAPRLIDVELRKIGPGPLPQPILVTLDAMESGKYDGELVTLEANTSAERMPARPAMPYVALDLSSKSTHFQAILSGQPADMESLSDIPSNSRVRVTGICRAPSLTDFGAQPFEILLRNSEDLKVIGPLRSWDLLQTQQILKYFAGITVLGLGWIWTLKQQVRKRTEEVLISEARYRTLIEKGPTPIIVLNTGTGRMEEANEAAAQFLSRSRKAMVGHEVRELGEDSPENSSTALRLEQQLKQLASAGKEGTLEWVRIEEDGSSRTYEIGVAPLDGGMRSATAWRDITLHKRTEEKALQSEASTRMINYFATSLLAQDTEEDILWDLAKNCVAKLGFVDCVIYLLNEDRTGLIQKAAYGPKCPADREIKNPISIPIGEGIVGSVARSSMPELIADTRLDARYIVDDELRLSELAVPIVAHGKTLGVIDSEHPRAGFFRQDHLEVLCSIASLCANKIVRVRAEIQMQRLNQELERRILERTEELSLANQKLRQEIAERIQVELKRQHTEEALRESTEQLRSSEERFSKAFRSSPSLMSITRMSDGRLIDINEAFLRSLRKTREETIGKTTIELGLWESEEERCAFLEALRTHGVVRNRERRFLIDGQPRIFLHSADVITLQDAPCLLTVAIDISARKKVEVELLKALDRERELSQLKSNFVATVSQERLFQAFHRGQNVGKIAGTGLGLVIVKRCVELHNGRIRFQSEEGRGTTFQVRLPLFPVEVNGVSNAGDSTWFFRKNEVGHIEL